MFENNVAFVHVKAIPSGTAHPCFTETFTVNAKVISAADGLLNITHECKHSAGFLIKNFRVCFSLRENQGPLLSFQHLSCHGNLKASK